MNKKILIISNAALSQTDSNGRNLARLLDCYSADEKAQFCTYGTPDFGECKNYYMVTDNDALLSFRKKKAIKNGEILDSNFTVANQNVKRKKRKTPFRMLAREYVWKHGTWYNKYLKRWLRENEPKCIFVVGGDNCFVLDLARRISIEKGIPLILYSTEEYQFKNYNYVTKHPSLLYLIWHKRLTNAYKKISKCVSCGIFNTRSLADLYQKEYGFRCYSLFQTSNIDFIENYRLNGEIIVSYLGNLGLNRHKALIEVANAIGEQYQNVILDVYGKPSDAAKKELINCPYINLKGFVPYEEVVSIIHSSTLVVHAEYFDRFYTRDLKYAFSTKISDSICSGTPFFLYAPSNLAETEFVKNNECAFVATNKNELAEQIHLALSDEKSRAEVVEKARFVKDEFLSNKGQIKTIIGNLIYESSSD